MTSSLQRLPGCCVSRGVDSEELIVAFVSKLLRCMLGGNILRDKSGYFRAVREDSGNHALRREKSQ